MANTMSDQEKAEQESIAARRKEFEAIKSWMYDNGAMHTNTFKVAKNITLSTFTFAGEILMIQEILHHGAAHWEFFMPVTQDGTWKGTQAALQDKLDRNKS